ncbi:hypothetical protein L1987_81210 [Smallanthus sonchifolius]|uniref:Uncharacterized protein n=1 Tax=Smallanthus sonchifolius TaxID=185202 RepID=A0ACB8YQW6_9ASTR|nr:hypothetical protein L1987_81210 [Smallanthus sonchifolius]
MVRGGEREKWHYVSYRRQNTTDRRRQAVGNATTFFVTNIPDGVSSTNLWEGFQKFGDAYVARKKDKGGNNFGFVRFRGTRNLGEMIEILNKARFQNFRDEGGSRRPGKEPIGQEFGAAERQRNRKSYRDVVTGTKAQSHPIRIKESVGHQEKETSPDLENIIDVGPVIEEVEVTASMMHGGVREPPTLEKASPMPILGINLLGFLDKDWVAPGPKPGNQKGNSLPELDLRRHLPLLVVVGRNRKDPELEVTPIVGSLDIEDPTETETIERNAGINDEVNDTIRVGVCVGFEMGGFEESVRELVNCAGENVVPQ